MKKKTLFKGTKRDYNYAYNKALEDVKNMLRNFKFDFSIESMNLIYELTDKVEELKSAEIGTRDKKE